MRFCELLNKEVEYIAISQDTTESDLKQVRQLVWLLNEPYECELTTFSRDRSGAKSWVALRCSRTRRRCAQRSTAACWSSTVSVAGCCQWCIDSLTGVLACHPGLEKAERNVLPTLNNLLENR